MEKQRFKVYRIDRIFDGFGGEKTNETMLGVTYATSSEKAINNIKYRYGIKPRDLDEYGVGDAGRISWFRAVPA